jgi:hypothetical protein
MWLDLPAADGTPPGRWNSWLSPITARGDGSTLNGLWPLAAPDRWVRRCHSDLYKEAEHCCLVAYFPALKDSFRSLVQYFFEKPWWSTLGYFSCPSSNIEMNMDTDKVIIENSDQTYHHGSNFDQGSSKRNNFNANMIYFFQFLSLRIGQMMKVLLLYV